MFQELMPSGSGGGSGETDLVTVYKDGSWENGFSTSTFQLYGVTQNADNLELVGGRAGICLTTNYTSQYKGIRIRYTTTNTNGGNNVVQAGICTSSAQLPDIVGGTGRVSYMNLAPIYSEQQQVGLPLNASQGIFFANPAGSPSVKITDIYFVKN